MTGSTVTFTLNPDDPCNTTITDEQRKTVYIVRTERSKDSSTTRISNVDDEVIASLVWQETGFRSDKVTLGSGAPKWVGSWLNKSRLPFNDDVSFKDDAGRRYKWKGNAPGRSLELYSADKTKEPIALFHKSRKDNEAERSSLTPATLVLEPRALEIQDIVVASFIFLERDRRTGNKSKVSKASALALATRRGGMDVPSNS